MDSRAVCEKERAARHYRHVEVGASITHTHTPHCLSSSPLWYTCDVLAVLPGTKDPRGALVLRFSGQWNRFYRLVLLSHDRCVALQTAHPNDATSDACLYCLLLLLLLL